MSPEALAIVLAALAVGAFSKAVTGFGLPLIAIPVMAPYFGVETAVVVMVIPGAASNFWLAWENRAWRAEIEGIWWIFAAALAGIVAGTWILSSLDERVLALAMAAWIGLYLASHLVRRGIRLTHDRGRRVTPVVVLIAGLFQGGTGIAGPIVVPYFHALRLAPETHVFAVSLVFSSFSLFQIFAITSFGLFTTERLIQGLLALAAVAPMTWLGIRFGRMISRRLFDACVLVLLAVMGVQLIRHGLGG